MDGVVVVPLPSAHEIYGGQLAFFVSHSLLSVFVKFFSLADGITIFCGHEPLGRKWGSFKRMILLSVIIIASMKMSEDICHAGHNYGK